MCNDSALPSSLQDSSQSDEEKLILESNPLEWSVTDVVRFIKLTDCAPLARIFQEQVPWFSGSSVYFLDSRSCLCVRMSMHKCTCVCVCVCVLPSARAVMCVMCAVTCMPVCT